MKVIHAYWDGKGFIQRQAELFRVWARSWEKRGWKTKVVFFESGSPEAKQITRAVIRNPRRIHSFKFGLLVSPRLINFSLRPRWLKFKARNFNSPGWDQADLVLFNSEYEALHCGRAI